MEEPEHVKRKVATRRGGIGSNKGGFQEKQIAKGKEEGVPSVVLDGRGRL